MARGTIKVVVSPGVQGWWWRLVEAVNYISLDGSEVLAAVGWKLRDDGRWTVVLEFRPMAAGVPGSRHVCDFDELIRFLEGGVQEPLIVDRRS